MKAYLINLQFKNIDQTKNMRKQAVLDINPFHNGHPNNEKNIMASDNKILKCLDCDEILIINWLNDSEKILVCSNNQVFFF